MAIRRESNIISGRIGLRVMRGGYMPVTGP